MHVEILAGVFAKGGDSNRRCYWFLYVDELIIANEEENSSVELPMLR